MTRVPSNRKKKTMTEKQNSNLTNLLAAWLRHDDVRRNDGSIPELADARFSLDQARVTTWGALR